MLWGWKAFQKSIQLSGLDPLFRKLFQADQSAVWCFGTCCLASYLCFIQAHLASCLLPVAWCLASQSIGLLHTHAVCSVLSLTVLCFHLLVLCHLCNLYSAFCSSPAVPFSLLSLLRSLYAALSLLSLYYALFLLPTLHSLHSLPSLSSFSSSFSLLPTLCSLLSISPTCHPPLKGLANILYTIYLPRTGHPLPVNY